MNLGPCLKKLGLSKHESAIMRALVRDEQTGKTAPEEAARRAVKGRMKDLTAERQSVQSQIDEFGKVGTAERANPVQASTSEHVEQAAARAEPLPSPAQIEAGNQRKGHFQFAEGNPLRALGTISIETAAGVPRVHKEGAWQSPPLEHPYGHLQIAEGRDGDKADVTIGPDLNSRKVYVIDQIDPVTGKFDETKSMISFSSEKAARDAYLSSFSDDATPRIGAISEMPVEQYVQLARSDNLKKAFAYKEPAPVETKATESVPEKATKPEPPAEQPAKPEPTERFSGRYKQGMTEWNAKAAMKDMAAKNPNMDYRVEPAPEFGDQRFQVVGYLKNEKPMFSREEDQTKTPEFKKWFGDSKVVDEKGNPLVVYRGDPEQINVFKNEKRGTRTEAKSAAQGFFFTTSEKVANGYTYGDTFDVIELKNKADSLERIAQRSGKNEDWHRQEAAYAAYENAALSEGNRTNKGYVTKAYVALQNPLVKDFEGNEYREQTYNDIIREAKKNGHDGVVLKNTFDSASPETHEKTDVIVAFKPEQIKSATGNTGTFDVNNPDIRFAREQGNAKIPEGFTSALESLKPIVSRVREAFPHAADVETLQSIKDAPQALLDHIKSVKGEQSVQAAWWKGKIYAFADNLNPADAERAILHEYGHDGLRKTFGAALDPVLRDIYSGSIKVQLEVAKLRRQFPDLSITGATEEHLANVSGTGQTPSYLGKVVAFIRNWLREKGFVTKFTDNDILNIVHNSKGVLTGEHGEFAPAFSREEDQSKWDRIIAKQRMIEGLRAAMRDPKTGKIYTGATHQAAIDKVPQSDTNGIWGRLSSEWDRGTDNTGFVDREGNFISRTHAEKTFGISTMEDRRDLMKKGPAFSRKEETPKKLVEDAAARLKESNFAQGTSLAMDGLKRAFAPQYRSSAALETARVITEGMGEREMKNIRFRSDLNKAIKEHTENLTLSQKARDLIEKGLTVAADKVFLRQTPEENHAFMQASDTGDARYFADHQDLKPLADVIGKMFNEKAKEVQGLDTGALQTIRENWFPHIWQREPSIDVQRQILSMISKRPFEGQKSFTKKRVFDDVNEGLKAGYKPVSDNPLDLVALKMAEMDKYILAHKTLKALEGSDAVKVVPAGEKMPTGYQDVNGRYGFVDRTIAGEVKKMRYIARDDVGQVINNYLSQSLYNNKYIGSPFTGYMHAANTLNQFQLGVFSAFHAGFTSYESVISHGAIGFKALTEGDFKGAAKYFAEAPMAWRNNPKLGGKIIEEMLNKGSHPEMADILHGLELAGFKWQMDNRFRTDSTKAMIASWTEGKKFQAAARTIPAIVEQSARPILEWLVPRQKFGVFGETYNKWLTDHPNASHEDMRNSAQQIWNRVDSRLGQVVYDRLFMNNVTKNIGQMLIRAPGWTGGTILEVGGGFKDLASYARDLTLGKKPAGITDRAAYVLSLVTVTALTNAILTAAFTGEAPKDWRDLVAFRTGNMDEYGHPERMMAPTYVKDIYAYSQHPIDTLRHKSHPLLSMVGDIGHNRDYYGTEIRSEDDNIFKQAAESLGYAAKQFVPFWIRGVQKEQQRGGSAIASTLPLVGVMPAPSSLNRTAAENLMNEYGAGRVAQGARTQAETNRAQLKMQMAQAMRKGDMPKAIEIFKQGREDKVLTVSDLRDSAKIAHTDTLINSFKHLTYAQAVRVMETATEEEQKKLKPWLIYKRVMEMRKGLSVGA